MKPVCISFSDVKAGTCAEEEGKGRGFLPSLQVTGEGRTTRRHEQRKRDGRGERGKERQKREKSGKKERWKKGDVGKTRAGRKTRQQEVLDDSGGRGDTGH